MLIIQLNNLIKGFDVNIQRQTGATSVITLEGPHLVGYLNNTGEAIMSPSMCDAQEYKAIRDLLDARGVLHATINE